MRPRHLAALLLLGTIWGASFLFIKVIVEDFSPIILVSGRLGLAAAALWPFIRWRAIPVPTDRATWRGLALLAVGNNLLPYMLIGWSEQHITSGLAAILNATMPLFTVLFAHWTLHDERLTPARLAGIVLGFAGVAILVGPDLADIARVSTQAQLAVIAASACYAASAVYMRARLRHVEPTVSVAGQAGLGFVLALPLIPVLGAPLHAPHPQTVASLLALGLLGSAFASSLYFWLMAGAGAGRASMVTYLLPFTALVWGRIVLGEPISPNALAGLLVIIGGVALVGGLVRFPRRAPLAAERPEDLAGSAAVPSRPDGVR